MWKSFLFIKCKAWTTRQAFDGHCKGAVGTVNFRRELRQFPSFYISLSKVDNIIFVSENEENSTSKSFLHSARAFRVGLAKAY